MGRDGRGCGRYRATLWRGILDADDEGKQMSNEV